MHERALSEVESLGGGFGCRLSLFDILKNNMISVLHSYKWGRISD